MGIFDSLGKCAGAGVLTAAHVSMGLLCGADVNSVNYKPTRPTPQTRARRVVCSAFFEDEHERPIKDRPIPYSWRHTYMPSAADRNAEQRRTVSPKSELRHDPNYGSFYGYTSKRTFVPAEAAPETVLPNFTAIRERPDDEDFNWRQTTSSPDHGPTKFDSRPRPSTDRDILDRCATRAETTDLEFPQKQSGYDRARCRRRINKIEDDVKFRDSISKSRTHPPNRTASFVEAVRCLRSLQIKLRRDSEQKVSSNQPGTDNTSRDFKPTLSLMAQSVPYEERAEYIRFLTERVEESVVEVKKILIHDAARKVIGNEQLEAYKM